MIKQIREKMRKNDKLGWLWNLEHTKFSIENNDQKPMQNANSINQSDTPPFNFMNNPLVNNNYLTDRGTGRRARIWYNY